MIAVTGWPFPLGRYLDRGHQLGIVKLLGQLGKPVVLSEFLQVGENVEYPFVFHVNSRYQLLTNR